MRWEPQSGGWILRISFTDQSIEHRFVGIVFPLSKGRWIWELLGLDLVGAVDSMDQAKKAVGANI